MILPLFFIKISVLDFELSTTEPANAGDNNPTTEHQQVEYQVVLEHDGADDDEGIDHGDGNSPDTETEETQYVVWEDLMGELEGEGHEGGQIHITIDEDGNHQVIHTTESPEVVTEQQVEEKTSISGSTADPATRLMLPPDSESLITPPVGMDLREAKAAAIDSSTNKKDLKQLMNIFIYECSMCTFSFRTEQELALHIYAFHRMASFNCEQCDFVTQDIEQFRRHEALHDGSLLLNAARIQGSGSTYICTQCMEGPFDNKVQLKTHVKIKHAAVECPVCKISLPSR